MNELRLRKEFHRQIRPRLEKSMACFDVRFRPTALDGPAFSLQQFPRSLALVHGVIVNRPAEHCWVESIALMSCDAVARVSPNQLIQKMCTGPTTCERKNGKHDSKTAPPAAAMQPAT